MEKYKFLGDPQPYTFFHGSKNENVESIKNGGLKGTFELPVSITADKNVALNYGDAIFTIVLHPVEFKKSVLYTLDNMETLESPEMVKEIKSIINEMGGPLKVYGMISKNKKMFGAELGVPFDISKTNIKNVEVNSK